MYLALGRCSISVSGGGDDDEYSGEHKIFVLGWFHLFFEGYYLVLLPFKKHTLFFMGFSWVTICIQWLYEGWEQRKSSVLGHRSSE